VSAGLCFSPATTVISCRWPVFGLMVVDGAEADPAEAAAKKNRRQGLTLAKQRYRGKKK